jgi:hypothetical protein
VTAAEIRAEKFNARVREVDPYRDERTESAAVAELVAAAKALLDITESTDPRLRSERTVANRRLEAAVERVEGRRRRVGP